MNRITLSIIAGATLAALAGPAAAAPLPLPWGGFEPPGGNAGDVFGIVCKTDRGLRNVLADHGYANVKMNVVDDDAHRVQAKGIKDGATWLIVMNSCTGKIIARHTLPL
jgi:hypothetical protein